MENFCSELVTSVVILPLTAGNYRRRENGYRYYDGTISSLVTFLTLLSIVIILTFGRNIDIYLRTIVFMLLIVIMILAMAVCTAIGCFIKINGLDRVVLRRQERSITKLQLIFLWIFGLSSGLLAAFRAAQQLRCDIFNEKTDRSSDVYRYSRGIFNITVILFLCLEMIFISYFVQFQMKRSTSVRYSLFIFVCANVSVWVHCIITDNVSSDEHFLDKQFGNKVQIPACLQNKTFDLLDKSKLILGPCLLEFCLLSTTMLFEMWSPSTCTQQTSSGDDSQTNEDDAVEWNYRLTETERHPLLRNSTTYNDTSLSGNGDLWTVYHLFIVILSVATTIGNIICYVGLVMHPNNTQIRMAIEQYGLVEYATSIGVILTGFFCLVHYCKPDIQPKPLKVSEYIYLSSAFAMIMMAVCEILTGTLSPDRTSEFTTISHVLGLVQIYLQVVFLLHASRCQKTSQRVDIPILDCVFIFLMVININFWIVDSFVLTSFPGIRHVEENVLGSTLWNIFHNILLPAGVFFRFSSVLEMFKNLKFYRSQT